MKNTPLENKARYPIQKHKKKETKKKKQKSHVFQFLYLLEQSYFSISSVFSIDCKKISYEYGNR